MKRPALDLAPVLNSVLQFGPEAPHLDAKLELLQTVRASPNGAAEVDRYLLDRMGSLHRALLAAGDQLTQVQQIVDRLSAPPLYPAVFLGMATPGPDGAPRAAVCQGHTERIVGFAIEVEPASLQVGDEVYLSHEMNVILCRTDSRALRSGETCVFDRKTSDGRLVVKSRDEEFIAQAPPGLRDSDLKPGDLLRWDRPAMLAREKVERSRGDQFFLEEAPSETFEQIGGLNAQIEKVKNTLLLHLNHAGTARKFRVRRKGSLLLHGPAGVGKTMLARALANYLAQIAPANHGRCLFMNIKPAALHSVWYSQSEANYREVFRVAREAGASNPGTPVVMFFDEVDVIGSRGQSHLRVDDRVLTAFLAELDGLESRGNILVVGATNRRETVDVALLRPGRLGDQEIEVPRPNQKGAREIFRKHLPPEVPYARNGHGDDALATRDDLIETAVSTIYAPNGNNELATITFRDGKRRPVRAADLISGAVIANIALVALERACLREVKGGRETGLTWEDLWWAISEVFESAARVLTPGNCRHHLSGLPHDSDVVNVEPVARKVSRPQRFLTAA